MPTQLPLDLAFAFEHHPIHAFLHDGKPAWLASEVAVAIDMADANKALRQSKVTERTLDYDVIQSKMLPWTDRESVQGQSRAVTILYESGLYALVLRSDKPAAIRFTRWVIRDVLPALRAQGAYTLLPAPFQGEKLDAGELLHLMELERKGSAYARAILHAIGLQPAAAEAPHA